MAVALLTTDKVESILRDAVSKGCYVEHDKSAGTAKALPQWRLGIPSTPKGKGWTLDLPVRQHRPHHLDRYDGRLTPPIRAGRDACPISQNSQSTKCFALPSSLWRL